MNLANLYKKAVIYPSFIGIIITLILFLFLNKNYKSEWLTKESVLFMAVIYLIIYCLIICILSLTIFLNQKIIRSIGTASFLSWFLLPITWIIISVYKTTMFRIYYAPETTIELIFLITINLPFVVGLIYTYILFIKYKKLNPSPKS